MQQSALLAPPDLEHLHALVTVATSLSFTAAARELALDPSVVARRIAALERRLGVRLLERTTRRMALTEAGETYLRRMRPALEELADAEAEVRDRGQQGTGQLRVSVPAAFGRMWIAPRLPAFLARYPDIALDLRFADRYVDLVAERFDLAVRLGALADNRLVARRIRDQVRGLYASPAYLARHGTPRSPAALAAHVGLGFAGSERPSQWSLSRHGKPSRREAAASADGTTVPVDVPLRLLSDDASALLVAALDGVGIVPAHDWLVHDAVCAGRLVRLLPKWTVGTAGAAWLVLPSTRFVPGKSRAFADWVVETLRELPTAGQRAGQASRSPTR